MTFPPYTYCSVARSVFWGTTPLSPDAVEDQLALFERVGGPEAIAAHCELTEMHLKAGGIALVTSLRAA